LREIIVLGQLYAELESLVDDKVTKESSKDVTRYKA